MEKNPSKSTTSKSSSKTRNHSKNSTKTPLKNGYGQRKRMKKPYRRNPDACPYHSKKHVRCPANCEGRKKKLLYHQYYSHTQSHKINDQKNALITPTSEISSAILPTLPSPSILTGGLPSSHFPAVQLLQPPAPLIIFPSFYQTLQDKQDEFPLRSGLSSQNSGVVPQTNLVFQQWGSVDLLPSDPFFNLMFKFLNFKQAN